MLRLFFFLCCLSILSQSSGATTKVSLTELLKKALVQNSELKMKDQDVMFAQSRLSEVKANMLPIIQSIGVVAPIYKDLGNALIHEKDTSTWGPLFKSMTYAIQPIYGFGKFDHYTTAATQGIEAEKSLKDMKEAEIILEVKKYYYTSQMALQMVDRLKESEEKLVKVIERVDELLKQESGEVREEDGLKLKVLLGELRQKMELAKKGSVLAVEALRYYAGYDPEVTLELESTILKQEKFQLKPMSYYEELAMKERPEMKALESGLQARQALVEAEKTNRLPLFFLGGLLDASDTSGKIRKDQSSPYAYDPYNSVIGGVGLGFKWDLDIWKVNAKLDGLKAEHLKLLHQKEQAVKGIPAEVKKAYMEFKEALSNIGHSSKQQEHAKKWFMQSAFAWSFGVGDSREVLESVIFKGFADKNYYDSLLNHNLSIGSLSKATGQELLPTLTY